MESLDHRTLEKLAEAAHIVWMEGKLRDGWEYGALTDKTKKIHSCLVPYDQLSEADKQSDRDIVRRIQEILAVAGYKIIKAKK
jgi:RyR domain